MSNKEGFISGAIAGALVATLIKPKTPSIEIKSNKVVINPQTINPNATVTLLNDTTYKFAIALIHGDGDQQITLVASNTEGRYAVNGNEQAVILIANEPFNIIATNADATATHSTPTIEIIYLEW
jgi:hypothetical protein